MAGSTTVTTDASDPATGPTTTTTDSNSGSTVGATLAPAASPDPTISALHDAAEASYAEFKRSEAALQEAEAGTGVGRPTIMAHNAAHNLNRCAMQAAGDVLITALEQRYGFRPAAANNG